MPGWLTALGSPQELFALILLVVFLLTERAVRQGAEACPSGSWLLSTTEVDDAVWAQVSEMARDTETFRAMLQAPRRAAQDKLAEANRREGAIRAELEQARKTLETISRRMGTEDDDAIYATLRQQYKETERQIRATCEIQRQAWVVYNRRICVPIRPT